MFKAEMRWLQIGPTLKMKGRLVGRWAEQARCLVSADVVPKGLIVDLNELMCVDAAGERFLTWLAGIGAVFAAGTAHAIAICERLGLSPQQRISAPPHGSKEKRSPAVHSHVG
jgi:hypothetical protein